MSRHSHRRNGSDRRHGERDHDDRRRSGYSNSSHGDSHRRSRSRERESRGHDSYRYSGGGGGGGGSWRSGGQQQQQQPWQSHTPHTGHGNRDARGQQHADVVLPVPLHVMRQRIDAEAAVATAGDASAAAAADAASATPASSCAFVTLVMLGDAYIPGALVLASSLRAAGTRAALVVLVSPDVSAAGRADLALLFDRVVEVPLLQGRAVHQEWKRYTKAGAAPGGGKLYQWIDSAFTKVHVLGLTDYAKVCLLDADMLCVSRADGPPQDHPDSLWALQAPAGICSTVADGRGNSALHGQRLSLAQVEQSLSSYGMRGCLYLLGPSPAHLRLLQEVLSTHGGYGVNRHYIGADEKLLTDLYADRWSHVHWRFGCNSWKSDEKTLAGKAVFLHYVTEKPWAPLEMWPDVLLWHSACMALLAQHPQLEHRFATHLRAVERDRAAHPEKYAAVATLGATITPRPAAAAAPAGSSATAAAAASSSTTSASASAAPSASAASPSPSPSTSTSISAAAPAAAGVSASDRAQATLLYNGVVYASSSEEDLARPYRWIAMRDGKVLEIGGRAPAGDRAGAGATASDDAAESAPWPSPSSYAAAHDLQGQTVLPGLSDAHIHVLMTGRNFFQIDVRGSRSIAELQQKVREGVEKIDGERRKEARGDASAPSPSSSASASPASAPGEAASTEWLVGSGWEQDELGGWPTRQELDEACPQRPLILWRVCSHVLVANTAALRAAGVRADTRVDGGEVDFEKGWLKESATELVRSFTTDTPAQTRKYLLKGMEICLGLGLTSVQTNDEHTWSVYKQLSQENLLPLRVFLTIQQDEMALPGRPRAREQCGEMLQCHRVKIFADGALGAQTASLSQAYVVPHRCAKMHGRKVGGGDHAHSHEGEESSASPAAAAAAASSASSAPPSPSPDSAAAAAGDNYGILIHSREALHEKVRSAHQRGFRVEMHVIGDRAAEEGLDAFEAAGLTARDRPILTHCQVLREDLVRRMVLAGAIADVQPQFAVTDSKWASERLPEELLKWSYCWKTLLDYGVHVAGGSDSPIEVANPLLGMHAAIFRPLQQYETNAVGVSAACASTAPLSPLLPSQQWRAEECVSVGQALHMYTTGAAYACSREERMGQLRPGWDADLTVVDRDVIRQPAELIRATVTQVFVAGQRRK